MCEGHLGDQKKKKKPMKDEIQNIGKKKPLRT